MADEPGKSNHLLLITTIITVAGAIIAAIITVSGNIKVEKIRQDAEMSKAASQPTSAPLPTSPPQTEPTTAPITITLSNYNCFPQDYYVDDEKVASVPAGETAFFTTSPGPHKVQACTTGSITCGDPVQIAWEVSTTAIIHPHPSCMVTVTLTNNHCQAVDYYVDNTLMVSSIAANTTTQFSVVPGTHQVYVCDPGTSVCGGTVDLTWNTSAEAGILKGPDCP